MMLTASRKIYREFSTYTDNPFKRFVSSVQTHYGDYKFYGLAQMNDPKIDSLPYCIRILLENTMRHCDQFEVKTIDVLKLLNWQEASKQNLYIPIKPSRVLLQDFAGVSSLVDMAAMRDALQQIGGDPLKINPYCPVHLVIDHSVQSEVTKTNNALKLNEKIQFEKNKERFQFLKWGSRAFENFEVIPPRTGILHQINLEFLSKIVMRKEQYIFPETLIGTDAHTSMANGLGVLSWGVGGLQAQVVMLGQPIPMKLPQVVGIRLQNKLRQGVTATDLALTLTQQFQKNNLTGKFVEFYGPGLPFLTVNQRSTISNMVHEAGIIAAYFPVDNTTLKYIWNRYKTAELSHMIHATLLMLKMFRQNDVQQTIKYTSTMSFDLKTISPSISGPKRPYDRISLFEVKNDWNHSLIRKPNKGGYFLPLQKINSSGIYKTQTKQYQIKHGSIIIASIDSCTNTINPKVLVAAALLAMKANQKGLNINPYIKTSFSPGSSSVTQFLRAAKLLDHLNTLGFNNTGYGCQTCIGNSGQIDPQLNEIIKKQDIIVCSVSSGNQNGQSKLHRRVKANYLMSPALVIAFAIAGNININLDSEPLGFDKQNKPVFLKDIQPNNFEIEQIIKKYYKKDIFYYPQFTLYSGTKRWNQIIVSHSIHYKWNNKSTYIQRPPYLQNIDRKSKGIDSIKNAFVLAYFGDQITTDHISPSGRIPKDSEAGRYLFGKGVQRKDFNTYGSRRGNYKVLIRGTFSHPYIINKLSPQIGPKTVYIPSGQLVSFTQAAEKYKELGHDTIILAGTNYGCGSTRDWAARGPYLLGVRAVIAESFDPKHRYNLIQMGILPLEFVRKQSVWFHQLTGKQTYTINIPNRNLDYNQIVTVSTNVGKQFQCKIRLDTQLQVEYYRDGGVLPFYLRKLRNKK